MSHGTPAEVANAQTPAKAYRVCGHKNKNSPGRCQTSAGSGTDHAGWGRCKRHGGNSPLAIREAAAQEARAMQIRFGQVVPIDPNDAMMTELGRANGAIARCEQDMNQLIEWWGDSAHLLYANAHWIALNMVYTDERDRLIRVAKGALDAGISERKQVLAEAMTIIFVEALRAAMNETDLSPAQRASLPLTLKRHMAGAMLQIGPGTDAEA